MVNAVYLFIENDSEIHIKSLPTMHINLEGIDYKATEEKYIYVHLFTVDLFGY